MALCDLACAQLSICGNPFPSIPNPSVTCDHVISQAQSTTFMTMLICAEHGETRDRLRRRRPSAHSTSAARVRPCEVTAQSTSEQSNSVSKYAHLRCSPLPSLVCKQKTYRPPNCAPAMSTQSVRPRNPRNPHLQPRRAGKWKRNSEARSPHATSRKATYPVRFKHALPPLLQSHHYCKATTTATTASHLFCLQITTATPPLLQLPQANATAGAEDYRKPPLLQGTNEKL